MIRKVCPGLNISDSLPPTSGGEETGNKGGCQPLDPGPPEQERELGGASDRQKCNVSFVPISVTSFLTFHEVFSCCEVWVDWRPSHHKVKSK